MNTRVKKVTINIKQSRAKTIARKKNAPPAENFSFTKSFLSL
jgi:hypothetical protein